MQDRTALAFGALLHDIGKVVYRGFSGKGTHSKIGAGFIEDEVAPLNADFETDAGHEVVRQIRYHHAKEMAGAALAKDSLAYITYFADNISAGMDRKNEGDEDSSATFDRHADLQLVFNILKGRHDHATVPHKDYNAIRETLKWTLVGTKIDAREVNSLLNVLEATCGTVPSSTNTAELMDISLYDHAKTTAAIAVCVLDYLEERGVEDYRGALFGGAESACYYGEQMFLLFSCDMSGIQDFLYNISGTGALKQLRARSLYLEMMLEHIADELLDRLGLFRPNLLYSGGGHAYLLLPNTARTVATLEAFLAELKRWFLERFGTDLFVASAWVACSADDLANKGDDPARFGNLFAALSSRLSDAKASRYTAEEIAQLNFGGANMRNEGRECRECHRSDALREDEDICGLCAQLQAISGELAKKDVFAAVRSVEAEMCGDSEDSNARDAHRACMKGKRLALPFGCDLAVYSREEYLEKKPACVRVYTKNSWDAGIGYATHVWMGDYTAPFGAAGISAFAKDGVTLEDDSGIARLGLLRADIDDLGAAFQSGLPAEKASVSRVATLSRALNYFFKCRINEILEAGGYRLQVVYAGGDDLFIVGNWSDAIYAAMDINREFAAYTGSGCLTVSAGLGMFEDKYPLARMAAETGELEHAAKMREAVRADGTRETKNAIALWTGGAVFGWSELAGAVEPRMREVRDILKGNDKGKAFIYKMISLLRNYDDVVSAPRLAYLLARSFESRSDAEELCRKFYAWAADERERACLVAALEWYVYSIRER